MLVVVTGGAASGKSEYAENILTKYGEKDLLYVATMKPFGENARAKIERHRKLRAGKGFFTVEKYTNITSLDFGKIRLESENTLRDFKSVIVECMSNYVANELYKSYDFDNDSYTQIDCRGIADFFKKQSKNRLIAVVTNEVFSDGVNYDPFTQSYIKILAELNKMLAEASDVFVEVVFGIPVLLKQI